MEEFEPHRALALRVAYRITRNAADAEDAVQDAFVKAWRASDRFRTGAPLRPWLLTIVANEARNRRRAAGRRAWYERQARPELPPEGVDSDVLAELGELPDEQRIVLAYRHLFSFTEEETAAALGVPVGTVKSRSARALARLRKAVVLVVVGLGIALLVPQSRAAILRFFDIERVAVLPPVEQRAIGAGLGPVVSRARAAAVLGTDPIAPPAVPLHLRAGVVSFFEGRTLVSELRDVQGILLKKLVMGSTRVVAVPNGVWLTGAPHAYFFPHEPPRLAGNVLLVQHGRLLIRLEAPGLTKAAALRSYQILLNR